MRRLTTSHGPATQPASFRIVASRTKTGVDKSFSAYSHADSVKSNDFCVTSSISVSKHCAILEQRFVLQQETEIDVMCYRRPGSMNLLSAFMRPVLHASAQCKHEDEGTIGRGKMMPKTTSLPRVPRTHTSRGLTCRG
jgi:hypothetical protein